MIGLSSIMSWAMAFTEIPDMIATAILGLTDNKILILLLINVLLLVVGTFMDVTPAILIFTPTSYMYSIWHEPNTVWYSALLQLINRNNYTSGWNNPLHGLPCWWSYY